MHRRKSAARCMQGPNAFEVAGLRTLRKELEHFPPFYCALRATMGDAGGKHDFDLAKELFEKWAGCKVLPRDRIEKWPSEIRTKVCFIRDGEEPRPPKKAKVEPTHLAFVKCLKCAGAVNALMDEDYQVINKTGHGRFCSSKCSRGLCEGCGISLKASPMCKCGNPESAGERSRMATRGEFYRWRALTCGNELQAQEFLKKAEETDADKPMERLTFGGFCTIAPQGLWSF